MGAVSSPGCSRPQQDGSGHLTLGACLPGSNAEQKVGLTNNEVAQITWLRDSEAFFDTPLIQRLLI